MKTSKTKTIIYTVLIAVALLFIGVTFGYSSGYNEGYELGTIDNKWVEYTEPDIPEPYWEEKEGEDWEQILVELFEQIDTANITIHFESANSTADIHLYWSK